MSDKKKSDKKSTGNNTAAIGAAAIGFIDRLRHRLSYIVGVHVHFARNISCRATNRLN